MSLYDLKLNQNFIITYWRSNPALGIYCRVLDITPQFVEFYVEHVDKIGRLYEDNILVLIHEYGYPELFGGVGVYTYLIPQGESAGKALKEMKNPNFIRAGKILTKKSNKHLKKIFKSKAVIKNILNKQRVKNKHRTLSYVDEMMGERLF